MGYNTNFEFEIKTLMTRGRAEQIANRLNELIEWEAFEVYVLSDDTPMNEMRERWKIDVFSETWYNWEKHMDILAKEFPDVEFYLEGNGENSDDWWIALFKGERKQIKYCTPPIDEWED